MPLRNLMDGYLRSSRKFFGIPEPEEGNPSVGVLGIPYDITSSHTPGARFGPDAFREATDAERSHSYPLTLTDTYRTEERTLTSSMTLEDIGDLEVGVQLPESAAVHMSDAAAILSKTDSSLVFLGGDHFITYPLIKGIQRSRNSTLGLVYLDAHADFYDDMGGLTLSHASTLKRIIDDRLVALEHVVGYDLRCAPPDQRMELGSYVAPSSLGEFKKRVKEIGDSVELVYISVDMDVLSPEVSPAVAHPESGGLSVSQLAQALDAVFATDKVRFCDIVEYNPLLEGSRLSAIAGRDILKCILTGFAYQNEFK